MFRVTPTEHNPLVIGLCGPAGSGKSTIAREIAVRAASSVDGDIAVFPFAGPMKSMIKVLGVPFSGLYGTQEQRMEPQERLNGKSARHALQTLGTEWGRNCMGEDFWVRAWESSIAGYALAIADDVRFGNEASRILEKKNGYVFRLSGRESVSIVKHSSEDGVDLCSAEIENPPGRPAKEVAMEIIDFIGGL